jgi:AraC-like DNA-binding protein
VIKTHVPQSPFLQNYIECFYVFNCESPFQLRYLAFPHYHCGLSFFKGVQIQRNHFQVNIAESPDLNIQIELLGKYINPLLINYGDKIQEISIVFKPLGINRFIRNNYQSIAPNSSQEFKNREWQLFGEKLFTSDNKIKTLEEFLLSEFKETNELRDLEASLSLIENLDVNYSISEIADKLGYNLKTFQRHFTKHIGCSPVDYRRIIRFRNAIETKLNAKELKSLTDITFENNYFDQSHFIKEFKRLTNHNPKKFFKSVSQLDGEKIIWEIL